MATSSGAGDLANELLPELISGKNFEFPDIDWDDSALELPEPDPNDPIFQSVKGLENEDLTTTEVGSTGTFDVIMTSLRAHLLEQFEKSRITGSDYTTAYVQMTTAALSSAVQFLLSKDQAYWQAIMAQQQAQRALYETATAKLGFLTARYQLALVQIQANTAEVEYARAKIGLATEDANFGLVSTQAEQAKYQLNELLPLQKELTEEQVETARSQTLDTRRDGVTPVTGTVGAQKALLSQQVVSYQRDSEMKAAKVFTDAWMTMKTVDEGLLPPASFANANLEIVLTRIQANNGLV